MKLLIMKFSHSPVTSSLIGSNILLNTLFSNTLSLQTQMAKKLYAAMLLIFFVCNHLIFFQSPMELALYDVYCVPFTETTTELRSSGLVTQRDNLSVARDR
jgi:putative effector of murein hydrolase LrgA (UPF0299 family)